MAGLLALVFALSPAGAGAQQAEAVRAAFVLNFLKFAEWPSAAPADSASALVIATMGDDAQSAALFAGLDGKEIQGRRITVRVFQDAEQWRREGKGCQALFITPSAAETWAELRAEIAGNGSTLGLTSITTGSVANPNAGAWKLYLLPGTTGGTVKLVARGASGTVTTILDNIPA